MRIEANDWTHRRTRDARAALLVLALALLAAACDTLDNALAVDAPSRIPAELLNEPSKATLLLNGAIADFDCAFGAYTVMGGLVGEELVDATQTADRWPYDRREVAPTDRRYGEFDCESIGVYTPLSRARWAAENLLGSLERWTDAEMPTGVNRTSYIAQAAAYSGYSHLLLGEGFCEGVLLGTDLVPGGLSTRQELFQRAVERFTRAIEAGQAASNTDIVNMARVGRARAYLNLGNHAAAGADARLVPASYVKSATASTIADRRYNRVFAQNNNSDATSVGPRYRNLNDPRVRVVDTGRTATDGTRMFQQTKYAGLATPLPIATGDEARLIAAEASARANDLNAALTIVNALRASAGLTPVTGTTQQAVINLIIEERRRELFLESHHLGDVIRYGLQLEPATGTTFAKGGRYGSTTCLPLPNVERLNNPNIRS